MQTTMLQDSVMFTKYDSKKVVTKCCTDNNQYKLKLFPPRLIHIEVNEITNSRLLLKTYTENFHRSKLRFFIKTIATKEEAIREYAKSCINKTIDTYKLLQEIKKEFPGFSMNCFTKYYCSSMDQFINPEGLTKTGYRTLNKFQYLDVVHIKLTLKTIAKFHAVSFSFEESKSKKLERRYELVEDYRKCFTEVMYHNKEDSLGFQYLKSGLRGLCALIEMLPNRSLAVADFKSRLNSQFAQAFEDAKPSKQFRNIWCNGDLCIQNLMFKYENGIPVSCRIFDFQLQRYSPPAHDVLYLIYQTTSKEIRQEYFDDLLDCYYESLRAELEKMGFTIENILSKDEFDLSIKANLPFIKLTNAISKSFSAVSKESLNKLIKNPELYTYIIFDDRSEFVVKEFEKNKRYRDMMTVVLQDLEDLFMHGSITTENCQKILKNKLETTKYHLIDYCMTPFNQSCGLLGDYSILNIKVKINSRIKQFTFFVKSIPKEKEPKEYILSTKLFFKEMKFFTEIIPWLIDNNINYIQECICNCYLALLNDVLVFDDYSSKGYITKSPRTSYDYETVLLIIKKLAKFHAGFLILEEKLSQSTGSIYRLNDKYKDELTEAFYRETKACVETIEASVKTTLTHIDLFPDLNSKISQELFKDRATKLYYRMINDSKPSNKYRNTICHGDLWSSNILIKYENRSPVDCIFVDFQITRYNPPAHDLMSFLYLSTNRLFRLMHMEKILNLYYLEITKIFRQHDIHVDAVLPYQEFLSSCKDIKEFAIIQSVGYFHNIMISQQHMKELKNDEEYGENMLFGDRGSLLRRMCAVDPLYKEKMKECITDLREICEKVDFVV